MVIHEMTWDESLTMLSSARLARLACARENQPYIVPLFLRYHTPYLYGFTMPGQKVEWMRANPHVCVQFDDIKSFDHWTSVLVFGRYEELPDSPEGEEERQRAYAVLQQEENWWQPGGAAGGHHGSAVPFQVIYFRIRIEQITGRRAVPAGA